jgi:hypothetical protein
MEETTILCLSGIGIAMDNSVFCGMLLGELERLILVTVTSIQAAKYDSSSKLAFGFGVLTLLTSVMVESLTQFEICSSWSSKVIQIFVVLGFNDNFFLITFLAYCQTLLL